MDTRSRKFDRSWITKTVCFFFALLFIAAGALKMADVAYETGNGKDFFDADNSEMEWTYTSNIFLQGKHFDLTTSEMFYRQFVQFMDYSNSMAMIYGDGSKKAYNEFLKRKNYVFEEVVEEYIGNLNFNKYSNVPEFIECVMKDDFVHVEKIADLQTDYDGRSVLYNNGEYSYCDYNDEDYDDDYDDEDEYSQQPTTDGPSVTVPATAAVTAYYENGDYIEFSKSIFDLAGKCDAIVLLNDAVDGYYGYYKITVDREKFKEKYNNYSIEIYFESKYYYGDYIRYLTNSFDSYDSFKKEYENAKEYISEYENLFYAVAADGQVISSNMRGVKTGAPLDKTAEKFSNYAWHRIAGSAVTEDNGEGFKNTSGLSMAFSTYENLWKLASEKEKKDYTLMVAFDKDLNGNDVFSSMENNYSRIYNYFRTVATYLLVCVLGFLVCLTVLIIKSGRRSDDDEMHMRPTDSIFTLLRISINGSIISGLCCLVVGIFCEIVEMSNGIAIEFLKTGFVLSCVATIAFFIDLVLYITRHIKNRTLIKNIFIVWLILKLSGKTEQRRAERKARREEIRAKRAATPAVFRDIFNDVFRKIVLYIALPNAVVGLIVFLFAGWEEWGFAFFLSFMLVIYDIFVLVYLLKYAYSLRKVLYTLEQVRQGNYDIKVDTDKMPTTVKAYADAINSIGDGLKTAVDNAVKEEKTKTELITNVSHDLKTPLTSIITYVDLLSRCGIENEEAQGYIEVLGEKSARLKRLIEDLVEASKATSNNIKVNLVTFSLNELAMQIVGEYEDEFESKGLKLVVEGLETEINVFADSKMSYRIMDNLMNNVRKYAMPGTRVYFSLSKEYGKAVLMLRNVSESQLNIPASELTARFVRGDASRSTEGSGLGLSIAESFSRLQGGKLTIDISGDLFTARVEFVIEQ